MFQAHIVVMLFAKLMALLIYWFEGYSIDNYIGT